MRGGTKKGPRTKFKQTKGGEKKKKRAPRDKITGHLTQPGQTNQGFQRNFFSVGNK